MATKEKEAKKKTVGSKKETPVSKAKSVKKTVKSNSDKSKQSEKKPVSKKTSANSSKSNKVKAKAGAAKDLSDLYEDGLKDIYWAEKALLKALPKMHKNATSTKLKGAILAHTTETKEHISRVEKCFEELGVKPKAEKCDAMAGLIEEAGGLIESTQVGAVRDAAIIAGAQKIEHYEIATYGTLAAYAKLLGHKKGLKHLLKSLEEEKACDELLSGLADTELNSKAE